MDIVVIVVAIALGAFVKGVTGVGLPQIAIPVMATFFGVERAVVIMAIPGIISNALLLIANRDAVRLTRDLPALLATGVLGAVVGTVALKTLDGDILSLVLAAMIGVYVVVVTLHPGFVLRPALTQVISPPVGLVAGALQGATGISGPLLSTYLHGFGLAPHVYVFSLSVLFIVFSAVQTATLFSIGLYTSSRLVESMLALIPIAIFLPLGSRVARRLSAEVFKRIVLVLLLATAAKLVYDALSG